MELNRFGYGQRGTCPECKTETYVVEGNAIGIWMFRPYYDGDIYEICYCPNCGQFHTCHYTIRFSENEEFDRKIPILSLVKITVLFWRRNLRGQSPSVWDIPPRSLCEHIHPDKNVYAKERGLPEES